MMEFLCPNGHRIRCQAEQAGRAAKCPRCGVRFRIPKPTDLDVSETSASDSKFSKPEFVESTGRLPTGGGTASKQPQIEFLCPNGHRLHGPAHLQGRPGECPECGSRFRIPTYEDIAADEATEQEISLGRMEGREASESGKAGRHDEGATPTTISGRGSSGPAMAASVARLWALRPTGASLELRLRDGETIVPDQFLESQSKESHQGVFVVKEPAGGLSLVSIAWDAIARVTLRGLSELPKELA